MNITELRIGKTIEVKDVRIIPVEQVTVQGDAAAGGGWWYGAKELYAVVINTPTGTKAVGQYGVGIDLNALIEKLPSLERYIESAVR